ncbi:MAG: class I SAM-dependent methyltransferase, partial [Pyrinomonadaceae bacterium]
MTIEEARARAAEISRAFYEKGDATGWFDALYAEAGGDESKIPWADLEPNPNFVAWLEKNPLDGAGKKGIVVGCGLGDDAEELARFDFQVTAFDISPKAIEWAKKIHPETKVNYSVEDLFNLPEKFKNAFDFVLEVYTVQALPVSLREKAIKAIAELVAPDGELLFVGRGGDEGETTETPPFPLRKSELDKFVEYGLSEIEFE